MKRHYVLLIATLLSTSLTLPAQHGGPAGMGRGGLHSESGFKPIRPKSFHDRNSTWRYRARFGDYNGYGDMGWADPFYADYGYFGDFLPFADGDYGNQPSAILVVATPQTTEPAPTSMPTPTPPATPSLREYSWPESGGRSGNAFAIVSKDGTVQRAIAVWVQDDHLCFVTPDGLGRQLLLNDVDRENTTRINSELKLKLSLPISDSGEARVASTS